MTSQSLQPGEPTQEAEEEIVDAEFSFSQQAAGFLTDWRAAKGWRERSQLARKRLDHMLHTRSFQIGVIVLVLLDAVIVVAELAIDLGLLESGGRDSLTHSPWPHVLHSVSLAILSLFMLETVVKLYAMGVTIIKHKMELFDMFIIVTSFCLDVASAVPGSQLTALFGLIVLLRLWRIVRIVNSIALSIRLQGRKALAKQTDLRRTAEARCVDLEARVAELEAGLGEVLAGLRAARVQSDVSARLLKLLPGREEEEEAGREPAEQPPVVPSELSTVVAPGRDSDGGVQV